MIAASFLRRDEWECVWDQSRCKTNFLFLFYTVTFPDESNILLREFLMCMPMSCDEEPKCCSPVHAGWCNCRIPLLLLTLASPSSLCNFSWFMWDICMKVGGEKYILGAICYPYLLYVLLLQLFLQRVYCYKILENKAAGDLESSGLSSCPNRILVPVLSLTFIWHWCVL